MQNFQDTLETHKRSFFNLHDCTFVKESSTIIDTIASNKDGNIKDTITIPTSPSDHFMVGCLRKLNNTKHLPRKIKCRDYSNYSEDILIQRFTAVDWSII